MIFPILGLKEIDQDGQSVPLDNYMKYKNKNVFGVISVDSEKRKAFNLGIDADTMKQLTSCAFGAFYLVQAIWDLSHKKGLNVVTLRSR